MSAVMPPPPLLRRRSLLVGAAALSGCTSLGAPAGPPVRPPALSEGAFVMPDGARLPYRAWLPADPPVALMLALHGMNDSRDAWEIPAPDLAAAGIALYAPDQRGFGAAPGRGLWPGVASLVSDAATMTRLVAASHPGVRLIVMGESMGGAVAMALAASGRAPAVAGWVLVSPAVWGRARMGVFLRSGLWLVVNTVPGLALGSAPGVTVQPSDNRAALIRLARDPLTIRRTRMDALGGLVDLMDAALAAAPAMPIPSLFLYGGKDELVPPEATAAMWRRLGTVAGRRRLFYPAGHHLLLRDLDRAVPLDDIAAWVRDASARLPSGAEAEAVRWLPHQDAAADLSRRADPSYRRSTDS